MISTALVSIPVGVLVEKRRANSPWLDYLYRTVSVLHGVAAAAPWTVVGDSNRGVTTYYAGEGVIDLHRTDTAGYQDNLKSGAPMLWVSLRAVDGRLAVLMVTADPAEGEALTGVGTDLVDTVPMPPSIYDIVAGFLVEHHVERPFVKRQRDGSTHRAQANERHHR